ncbi:hypothetical protein [Actinokineospora xionganensis]|uniref:Ribbon-helix-helix CopG family protein n=1 Tax=Actinokineospora xionganensis TaxID=2684470 RepID=A0ABR7LDM6_9PSEU|nr:hypothetical protein [Actinokineospora xionganensis]MBC6450737.1 hypothetical protein [Actinokineospora xionganensis]
MRLHISIDDGVIEELDKRVGARQRNEFIERAVRQALGDLQRAETLEQALGSIEDPGPQWGDDPAGWVRNQRTDRAAGGQAAPTSSTSPS